MSLHDDVLCAGSFSVSGLPLVAAYLDRVQCTGDETDLLACGNDVAGDGSCSASEGAGVRCECE